MKITKHSHKDHLHGLVGLKDVNFLGSPEEYTEAVKRKTTEFTKRKDEFKKNMKKVQVKYL